MDEDMKANELQIGDWVECTYWNPSKQLKVAEIRRIMDDEIKIGVYIDDLVLIFRQSEVKPIPLTPEILKKNGFEYFHKNYASLSYDHPFKIEMLEWPDENGLGGLWSITDLIKIRYVHELQHALRLCEIEKEIIL